MFPAVTDTDREMFVGCWGFFKPQFGIKSSLFLVFCFFLFCSTASRAAAPESAPPVVHPPGSYLIAVLTATIAAKTAASSSSAGYVPGPRLVPPEGPTAGL